ncbi:MAG: VOC family protein [Actinomycetota bacterium]
MAKVRNLNHVGVVVDDLRAATEFFVDLGLEASGTSSAEGAWVGDIIGLKDVSTQVAFVRTPDGSGTLELIKFQTPADPDAPQPLAANRLGLRHLAFVVDDLDAILDNLSAKGFTTVGTVHDYEDVYRLCYVRGPEEIIVELAEELSATPG